MSERPKYTLYFECEPCDIAWEEPSDDEHAMAECEKCGRLIDEPKYAFAEYLISL